MKKLLIAGFKHETDSFCPVRADMQAFRDRRIIPGEILADEFRGVKNEPGAFFDVFRDRDDIETIPVIYMNAMPSGPVTGEAYDYASSAILNAVMENKPDGILLSLHGAMVADGHPDGEGDLLENIRAVTGPDVPLVASLDLHANITPKMAANADALVPYEEYPHTDMYETGYCAAKIMEGILTGTLKPAMGYHRIPYLNPMFPSGMPQIRRFHDLCRSRAKEDGFVTVRLAHGFYPSDIAEMGMSVIAITDGDPELAQRTADEIGNMIWEARDTLKRHFVPLDEALALISEDPADPKPGQDGTPLSPERFGNEYARLRENGPLVIADASDNPGGGGLCDTTFILRRVLEKGITGVAFGMFTDPENAAKCAAAGVGSEVDLLLGGMSDPAFSGGPVPVHGVVRHLHDGLYTNRDEMSKGLVNKLGLTAVVEAAGNLIIISSLRVQPYDAEIFRCSGIDPLAQKALVVKSAVHYRNSYGKFARRLVDVCLPGFVVPVPDGLPFRNWRE